MNASDAIGSCSGNNTPIRRSLHAQPHSPPLESLGLADLDPSGSPQASGRTLPGFRIPSGSRAVLTARIIATAPLPRWARGAPARETPIPCSAVTVPPRAIAARYRASRRPAELRLAVGIVALEDEVRVEVAVADVAERRDPEAVLAADPLDLGQQLRHPAAGHADILHPGDAEALHRVEGEPAGLAEPVGLGRARRRRSSSSRRHPGRPPRPARAPASRRRRAGPIRSSASRRRPGRGPGGGRRRRPGSSSGRSARGCTARRPAAASAETASPAAIEAREEGQQRRLRRRRRAQPKGRFGDQGERPLRADDQAGSGRSRRRPWWSCRRAG